MQAPLNHFTTPKYWKFYYNLPANVRDVADKYFSLLKQNPKHPSLHLKKIDDLWSVRAGIHYRALGMDTRDTPKGILWFWIGSHHEYERLIRKF
jgi:hypothetical protein